MYTSLYTSEHFWSFRHLPIVLTSLIVYFISLERHILQIYFDPQAGTFGHLLSSKEVGELLIFDSARRFCRSVLRTSPYFTKFPWWIRCKNSVWDTILKKYSKQYSPNT